MRHVADQLGIAWEQKQYPFGRGLLCGETPVDLAC